MGKLQRLFLNLVKCKGADIDTVLVINGVLLAHLGHKHILIGATLAAGQRVLCQCRPGNLRPLDVLVDRHHSIDGQLPGSNPLRVTLSASGAIYGLDQFFTGGLTGAELPHLHFGAVDFKHDRACLFQCHVGPIYLL